MFVAGLDIGSTTTKCVLLSGEGCLASRIRPSGVEPAAAAALVLDAACGVAGCERERVDLIATTGYGRRLAGLGDVVLTEIKACSLGLRQAIGKTEAVGTIVDVGGQDTKVIRLDPDDGVEDFAMNDKCAAGTGRFLEMLAGKLDMNYQDFVAAALASESDLHLNATCAVFAESEVVSLLAHGASKEDIAAAAHNAIAQRIASMARRIAWQPPLWFVGGGARNDALRRALVRAFETDVFVPDQPQFVIALGAAAHAAEKLGRRS